MSPSLGSDAESTYREHNMIRFRDGLPEAVWYSQHEYGLAYTYNAVQKIGKRPVSFSARGSHANYAVAGAHDLHEISTRALVATFKHSC